MGAVYLAKTGDNREVAVKVLSRASTSNPAHVARFKAEARAMKALHHPNCVEIISFGEEEETGLQFLAMEYLKGQTLTALLQRVGRLSALRSCHVAEQILAALTAAHQAGVVHRDLKPSNVMLIPRSTNDPRVPSDLVKVCDFGVAKIMSTQETEALTAMLSMTQQGGVVGTPAYMSPEQAKGDPVDARSDIYSVGVLLFQMVTGRRPHQADSLIGLVTKVVTEAPPPVSSLVSTVDPRLEAIIERAMAKKREERFQAARDMRDALLQLLAGDTPEDGTITSTRVVSSLGPLTPTPPSRHPSEIVAREISRVRDPAGDPSLDQSKGGIRGLGDTTRAGERLLREPTFSGELVRPAPNWTRRGILLASGAVAAGGVYLLTRKRRIPPLVRVRQFLDNDYLAAAEQHALENFATLRSDFASISVIQEMLRRRREVDHLEDRLKLAYDSRFVLRTGSWRGDWRDPKQDRPRRVRLHLNELAEPFLVGAMDWPDVGVVARLVGFYSGNHFLCWESEIIEATKNALDAFKLNDKKNVFVTTGELRGFDGPSDVPFTLALG